MNLTNQVERYLAPVCAELSPIQGLDEMFTRCFLNTLETTCQGLDSGDAFIITGDIQAMWLRDSTEQILHYLLPRAEQLDHRRHPSPGTACAS